MPTETTTDSPTHRPDALPPALRPLRLWPGIVIVAVVWLGRFVLPYFVPEATVYGVFGGLLGSLAVLFWWVTFSRAPAREHLAAVILVIAALLITPTLLHRSMTEGGMGLMFYFFVAPVLSAALVMWAVATRRRRGHARLVTMALAIAAACGVWTLVRTDGVTGDFDHDFRWRWAASASWSRSMRR